MRAAAVVLLLAALPSFAESVVGTRVSPGDYRQPELIAAVPPLATGSPVRLIVNFSALGQWTIAAPRAERNGTEITITQTVTRGGPDQDIALHLLDFGPLPAGLYHATITQTVVVGTTEYPKTQSRAFIVQSPPPSSPCSGTPQFETQPVIAVTRTAAGTAHLHFEESRRGYAPAYGPPSVVDIRNNGIAIEQPLVDTFDYTLPDAPPFLELCHAEDIDLRVLPEGTYSLSWSPIAMLGGHGPYTFGGGGAFVWSGERMLCSTMPQFAASPGSLALTRLMYTGLIAPTTATVSGHTITVTDYIDTEGPAPPPGFVPAAGCVTTRAAVGPLAPGEYIVKWQILDVMMPPRSIGTYRFTVPSSRPRPTRH